MDSSQQLVSNYVRFFLDKEGGAIRFVPKRDRDGRMCWEVFGIFPDGNEQQVKLSKTGHPKILKSADALVAYWQSLYPEATEVSIPILSTHTK